mmetsp:Transcript_119258/g.338143  ORF Transcript_119258/g.338143 Transcript_119258/m.338143 type:complete len:260 (-) Transcript_119258:14-793(-)
MASNVRISLALAMLIAGGAALQLAAEAENVCGPGFVGYEHLNETHPNGCLVYCVPEGECVKKAESGAMAEFQLGGRGDCLGRNFTESAPLGKTTAKIAEKLESFAGPCRGMKVKKFQKKLPEWVDTYLPLPKLPPRKNCGVFKTEFHAIMFRGGKFQCRLYCVPGGKCLGEVQSGQVLPRGITVEGNCADEGYTVQEKEEVAGEGWIRTFHKSCDGLKTYKFTKPPKEVEQTPELKPWHAEPEEGQPPVPESKPAASVG